MNKRLKIVLIVVGALSAAGMMAVFMLGLLLVSVVGSAGEQAATRAPAAAMSAQDAPEHNGAESILAEISADEGSSAGSAVTESTATESTESGSTAAESTAAESTAAETPQDDYI